MLLESLIEEVGNRGIRTLFLEVSERESCRSKTL